MTMIPEYKICPKCHKQYSWNPDVGQMFCPYCAGLGIRTMGKKLEDLKEIIKAGKK